MSTLAVTTAHAFVLTVSHGLLFRQPLDYLCNGRFCRRFLSSFTALPVLRLKTPKNFPVSIFSLDRASVSTELLWLNVIVTTSTSRFRRHDFDKPYRRQQRAGFQSASGAITHAPNP